MVEVVEKNGLQWIKWYSDQRVVFSNIDRVYIWYLYKELDYSNHSVIYSLQIVKEQDRVVICNSECATKDSFRFMKWEKEQYFVWLRIAIPNFRPQAHWANGAKACSE